MNCKATNTDNIPHQTRHHISPPRGGSKLRLLTRLHFPPCPYSADPWSATSLGGAMSQGDGVMDADNAMLPGSIQISRGPVTAVTAPPVLWRKWAAAGDSVNTRVTGHHATTMPPHTGNLTNIWSCCESKVSLIIGSAFFLYKLFPVRWAAAGCLHGRSFSSSKLIGTLEFSNLKKGQIHATFTSV